MNTHDLDTPCGFCGSQGRREISGGRWLSGPVCADCGGSGYLLTSPDAERLLAFLLRHFPVPEGAEAWWAARDQGGI